MRVGILLAALPALLALAVPGSPRAEGEDGALELRVNPEVAEIGDPVQLELELRLPEGERLQEEPGASRLGPFSVTDSAWADPRREEQGQVWTWRATLVAFETGELEIPPIVLRTVGPSGETTWSSDPRKVTIRSVLEADEPGAEPPELADLKPPASLPPRLGPLWTALAIFAGLFALAALLWWLHRRYRGRFAAVPVSDDPFRRTPPHVWIYSELQRLLDRRLAEHGHIDQFYAELARLLKLYLGGRFRLDLMEHTTVEVPLLLEQVGTKPEVIRRVEELLRESDGVKFARALPDPSAWRNAVERVYRIVDTTKPREAEGVSEEGVA